MAILASKAFPSDQLSNLLVIILKAGSSVRNTRHENVVYHVPCIVYIDTYTIQKILNFLIHDTYTIILSLQLSIAVQIFWFEVLL